ncbi:MAG: molybdopterin-binding protein [Candidatus Bathyarchaeota archaeon]|nr:molybdopterin-binding protein [Candidatus Bathyarchaeota archaeon]
MPLAVMAGLEILCIGNELLIGKVLNTNASWLGKRSTELGVNVNRITVVADIVDDIAAAIREAVARKPKFILTTGGLGPTFDDKTLQGLALALNRSLSVDEEALRMVKEKCSKFSLDVHPEQISSAPRVKMATLPQGTTPVANPIGAVPGVRVNIDGVVLVALPGVPAEVEAIFDAYVASLLAEAGGGVRFYEKSVYVLQIMESVLAPLIDEVMQLHPLVYVKSHPNGKENKPCLELHLSTSGKPLDNPQERLDKASEKLVEYIVKSGGKIDERS